MGKKVATGANSNRINAEKTSEQKREKWNKERKMAQSAEPPEPVYDT